MHSSQFLDRIGLLNTNTDYRELTTRATKLPFALCECGADYSATNGRDLFECRECHTALCWRSEVESTMRSALQRHRDRFRKLQVKKAGKL